MLCRAYRVGAGFRFKVQGLEAMDHGLIGFGVCVLELREHLK